MSFTATVYRILIASPGDVGEERMVIPQVINEWNDLSAAYTKIIVLPVKWETHSAPILGDRPQGILNNQLAKECDLLVGLFWTRIGSHTGIAESGTVEEIEHFIKLNKPVMLYFSTQAIEPSKIDIEQYSKLKEFQKKIKSLGLYETYSSMQDLKEKFSRQLTIHIQKIQSGQPIVIQDKSLSKLRVKNALRSDNIYIEDYEKDGKVKSFLVKGDTIDIKDVLKENGGRWNGTLKGWIFPKSKELEIAALLKQIA